MKKILYILITILLFVSFFQLALFSPLFASRTKPFVFVIWYILGIVMFRHRKNDYSYKKERHYWFGIMIGFLFTFLIVMVYEDPFSSFNAYLGYFLILLYYFAIPVLLYIQPSKQEIIYSCWLFSLLYILFFILRIFEPLLFLNSVDEFGVEKEIQDNNYGFMLEGYSVLMVPLFYYLARYKDNNANKNDIMKILLLIGMIIINQNRSTIFTMLLVLVLSIWNSKKIILKLIVALFVIIVILEPTLNPLFNLLDETYQQATDKDYARYASWSILPAYASDTWVHTLFGHGYGPQATSEFESMKSSFNVDTSDVGFIGFWSRCGLLPLIVMLNMLISAMLNKKFPLDVKYFAITITICSATISYFLLPLHIIWFIIFFLLWSDSNRMIAEHRI